MVNQNKSMLSGTFGEAIAEFFGTMVLILFGCGCVATFSLFGLPQNWMLITIGWGLAVMLGVYTAGAISGAHINPAVTIAQAVAGQFSWAKVAPYIIAQVLGAFVAAAIIYFVNLGPINHALMGQALSPDTINNQNLGSVGGVFYTGKKDFVGWFGAFGAEALGTALLVGLIFAITDGRNQPVKAGLNPLIIGLLVVAIGTSFGQLTGYAINPARDFGPRLWMTIVGGGTGAMSAYTWVPIVGPIVGGIIGALVYQFGISKILTAIKVNAPVSGPATEEYSEDERPLKDD